DGRPVRRNLPLPRPENSTDGHPLRQAALLALPPQPDLRRTLRLHAPAYGRQGSSGCKHCNGGSMKVIHVETGMHLYGGALQVFFLLRGLADHPGEHILVCPLGSAIADAAREFVRVIEIPCRGDHDLISLWRLKKVL